MWYFDKRILFRFKNRVFVNVPPGLLLYLLNFIYKCLDVNFLYAEIYPIQYFSWPAEVITLILAVSLPGQCRRIQRHYFRYENIAIKYILGHSCCYIVVRKLCSDRKALFLKVSCWCIKEFSVKRNLQKLWWRLTSYQEVRVLEIFRTTSAISRLRSQRISKYDVRLFV